MSDLQKYLSGSITPTSQGKPTFFLLNKAKLLEKLERAINNPVSHSSKQLEDQLNSLKAKSEELRVTQEALGLEESPIFEVNYEGQGLQEVLKIKRIGIDPSLLNIPHLYLLYPDQLHYAEQEVLRKALYSLGALSERGEEIMEPPDKEEESENSVVAIDLIKRQNGSVLTRGEEEFNEIHTALLWKHKSQIILIDPNRGTFSSHLLRGIKKKFNVEVESFNMSHQFYFTKNGQTQIRNDKIVDVETGYCPFVENFVKPRDCIDLAIKIGFEILELQKEDKSFANIKEGLQILSNNKQIHVFLGVNLDTCFMRELQSSKSSIRRETAAWIAKNSTWVNEIAAVFPFLAVIFKSMSFYGLRMVCPRFQPFMEHEKKLREHKEKQRQNQRQN